MFLMFFSSLSHAAPVDMVINIESDSFEFYPQEEKVEYLESVVKSLSTRGYLIKNAIDWKRFTEGH